MNVDVSPLYCDLDRGDGICEFFDCDNHLCNIYSNRPFRCNIDKAYNLYFEKIMTKEQYYQLNYEMCKKLIKGARECIYRY